jgi:hypothetical protein
MSRAAGTSVRFEPGETKSVSLVPIAGHRVISGGNGLCTGSSHRTSHDIDALISSIIEKGFGHKSEVDEHPSKRMRSSNDQAVAAAPQDGLLVTRS